MTAEKIRYAALIDCIGVLSTFVMHGLPLKGAEAVKEVLLCQSFRDEAAVIDRIAMKGRRIIIPVSLQKRPLNQFHVKHMCIEKTRLLT